MTTNTYTHHPRRVGFTLALFACLPIALVAREADSPQEPVFSMALSSGELTMDPVHAYRTTELQIATGIYEGLVVYDPHTLRPAPGVAYRWDVSEDRTRYRFHLRRRARFSNGDPVTAADFRDSWLRVIDPDESGEYSFFFDVIRGVGAYRHGETTDPDEVGIRVVDDHTLEVELVQPASHFLSMLCHMTFSPIHESYRTTARDDGARDDGAEDDGAEDGTAEDDRAGWETGSSLVTNGPYSLARWDEGTMRLERNPHYWDSWNVDLPVISISFGVPAVEASKLINAGELQWALNADVDSLEDRGIVQVNPLFATSYLYFRADAEPWSDVRVRRGLARMIGWSDVRDANTNFPADTLVPALSFYPEVEGLSDADTEAGLELLSEAGFPDGAGLPEILIVVIPGSIAEGAALELKSLWEERLAVTVEIRRVGFSDYQREVRRGGYTIGSSTWIGDFADPLAFLQMWTGGSNLNDAKYRDETYDDMIRRAMGETGERRFETLASAERRLLTEEVVVLPLSHSLSVNFIDLDSIGGWYANALDVHPLKSLFRRRPTVPDRYVRAEGD